MKNKIRACFVLIFCISLKGFSQEIKIKNLKLNDKNNHFAISYLDESRVVFTTNLLSKRGKQKVLNNIPSLTLFQGEVTKNGEIINVSPLPYEIDSNAFNPSSSTFYNADKKKYIIITTNSYNTDRDANLSQEASKLRIEIGEYVEGEGWVNFKVPSFCNEKYSYGHPFVSPDGKYMYFVSNMGGGFGATDIFRVTINENNVFGKPENLGKGVNTRKKELFPFVSKENILYFSSNRPEGKGLLDIYKSQMLENGTFGKAELLDAPINSRYNEYSYILNEDLESGYFTSARPKGKGGDDLYYFYVRKK